jgi:UDP-N-acetylmuramoylalanine--D-glutamate ligase
MQETLTRLTRGKRVCLLGFGLEGRSTFNYFRKTLPDLRLTVLDKDAGLAGKLPEAILHDPMANFILGDNYLSATDDFDLFIKSPGITLHTLNGIIPRDKLTSQTDLFLSAFHSQVFGVTGTKGKSTTASLIYHLMRQQDENVMLVGNIGTPPFEMVRDINRNTRIVYELSAHQLEIISKAPKTAILLNLLPEHLDHFSSLDAYHAAKLNMVKLQDAGNILIYNHDDHYMNEAVQKVSGGMQDIYTYSLSEGSLKGCYLKGEELICNTGGENRRFSIKEYKLKGTHNILNLMAAVLACKVSKLDDTAIIAGISSFKGLRHRLEYVGFHGGLHFYNDSIATIPEATMEALKTLGKIDILILGGHDRRLDYSGLVSFLILADVHNIICIGEAGDRILAELREQEGAGHTLFRAENYDKVFEIIKDVGKQDGICLLSPAAASYDMFKNFEERGDLFTRLARSI